MKTANTQPFYQRQPIAIVCIAVAIVTSAGTYFRSSEIVARQSALEQKSAEGQRLLSNITNATLLKEHYDALVAINGRIAERLVSPAQLGENLQLFYKIEAATGCKISDLRQTYAPSTKEKARFVPVPYGLNVRGDYRSVLNFVRKVEKSPRFARVSGASLTQMSGDAAGEMQLSLSVELLGVP
jgi:Tfp pilus assembly protein PilO